MQHQPELRNAIRAEPLTKEEKAELTALLAKLRILPYQGQVALHCGNGSISRVGLHTVLKSKTGDNSNEGAQQKLQQYIQTARRAMEAGDTEKAKMYRKLALNLERVLAED
jgi:hypothetical protein